MKKHSIHFLFLAALLAACQPGTRKEQNVDQHISRVENGLLPSIVLASDTAPQMNILDRMKHYHVPGLSIAVINHGRIEWAKGYGFADSAGTRPVDTHTLFQAASISKPVAALAALSMVEEGYFPLDEDVNHYLQSWKVPENRFTVEEKVTLRRLLSHSAGLTVHGFDGYEAGSPLPSIQQILNGEPPANSPAVVADTTPGAINRYSGGGYTVMQLLMQESAGQAFPALMKEKVLIPLQMENSTYEQPLPVSLSANAAVGHDQRGRPVPGNWHTYPEMAAAGLWTTPTDLARFAIELEGSYLGTTNRILTKEMTREMLSQQGFEGQGLGLGIGGEADSLWFQHGGANVGYKCNLFAFAGLGEGAVIMTNGDNGYTLIREILRSLSEVYGWNRFKPAIKKMMAMSPEKMAVFTGTYRFIQDPELVLEVSLAGDSLLLEEKYAGQTTGHIFLPESDSTFFNPETGEPLQFYFDENNRVSSLKVQWQWIFIPDRAKDPS